jgi:hypothetical protein
MQEKETVEKPDFGRYAAWLEANWRGDNRELRPGRFMHQQADLRRAFESSPYWAAVNNKLPSWAEEYSEKTGHRLFSGGTVPLLVLHQKPWDSFLNKTWRVNVRNNPNWPAPPVGGWVFPDTWFEQFWDAVRARFAVRYLDGVAFLSNHLYQEAVRVSAGVRVETKAKETGYYAVHIVLSQNFAVQALDYGDPEPRRSEIEIQVTTELQEVVGELTHIHFERDRTSMDADVSGWQWEYARPEFSPYYLGHVLHWIEGVVMNLRDSQGECDES